MFPISLRPKYINNRDEIGHLEIDLIIGTRDRGAHLLTMVDRMSRRIYVRKVWYKNEYYIAKEIDALIKEEHIDVKSITCDNGTEFAAIGLTAKRNGIKAYRCDPYCSFQRGTNENANRMIRRYFPKRTSFNNIDDIIIKERVEEINSMPREILN